MRIVALLLAMGGLPAAAQPEAEPGRPVERIWDASKLYRSQSNSVIQGLSLLGRYHGQHWPPEVDEDGVDAWTNRRFYLGAEALLFRKFSVQAQIKVKDDFNPVYNGLYEALVRWKPNEAVSLTVGRQDYLFTGLERSISSNRIVTFERGLLVNQLMPSEVVGAMFQGETARGSYRAGVFSGSIEKELTHFKGGTGAVAGAGYGLPLFYETGNLHVDYLFNNGNPSNNALKPYDHVVSVWHQGQAGRFGMGVDLTAAHGLDHRPAVFGATLLPTYVFAKDVIRRGDALLAVLRYQFAVSDGSNGLHLKSRYEQEFVRAGSGDRYHAVYAGLNYPFFGDRLKLMTGAEYASMNDTARDGGRFGAWTYGAGVRLFF